MCQLSVWPMTFNYIAGKVEPTSQLFYYFSQSWSLSFRPRGGCYRKEITVKLKDKNNIKLLLTVTSPFSSLEHACLSFRFIVVCPHCSFTLSRSSVVPISTLQWRGDVKSLEAGRWARASHSCVTSATSQPALTGRGASQLGDL